MPGPRNVDKPGKDRERVLAGEVVMRIGDWRLNPTERSVCLGDKCNRLSPKSWDTLLYLAERAGEVVSKSELLERFWRGDLSEDTAVRKSILEIRRALEDDPKAPAYIQTLNKIGYALVAQVDDEADDSARIIAVLPFDNLTGDASNDHLGDGLSEEIINVLTVRSTLQVVARNSSFRFKDQRLSIEQLAEHLHASFVVEGSIRRHGEQIRTTIQLIDTDSGVHLTSRNFDHDLKNEITFYDQVASAAAAAIMDALAAQLGPEAAPQPHDAPSVPSDPIAPSDPSVPRSDPTPKLAQRRHLRVVGYAAAGILAVVSGVMLLGYLRDAPVRVSGANATSPTVIPPGPSLAALPFEYLGAKEGAWLASGLYEELMNNLYSIGDIVVMSTRSVMPFDDRRKSTQEIAEALHVAYILDGSVRQQEDRLRINIRLTDTRMNTQVWAEQYDATGTDIFKIEGDIALSVAEQLAITLSERTKNRIGRIPTRNWQAYRLVHQALGHADGGFWAGQTSESVPLDSLRRAIELDPGYGDAKYWLVEALRLRPDWYLHQEEMKSLATELLAAAPDDAYVNRLNAFVIGLSGGDSQHAYEERERLLRHAVELMPNNSDLLVDLALFLYQAGLAKNALQIMRNWETRNPGVVSPLLAQLDLSFRHDPRLASHYAEVILANDWGGPQHVAPYFYLQNDFVTAIELLVRPAAQQSFGDDTAAKFALADALMSIDPDAALAWLDWLEDRGSPNPYLKPMRAGILMLRNDRQGLETFDRAWQASGDPTAIAGQILLQALDAYHAVESDAAREHLSRAYELSKQAWAGRRSQDGHYDLRGFQTGWDAVGFAMLAAIFDPPESAKMLQAVQEYYAAGAAHWNIADKYAVLTIADALSGDVSAALEQYAIAERYGFRALYRYEILGVFHEGAQRVLHGLAQRETFESLTEKIRQRNRTTRAAVQKSAPEALDPRCYSTTAVGRSPHCSLAAR